ncbi:MAG: hypothetical protein J5858_07510 [Lentisphaeria bacterium]|nr:hypothetical protein [Lentisphaeria bacterium]
MPTNLQITLDTTQYQQQLDKVISETGNAAKSMTDTLNVTGKGLDKSITIPVKTSGGELKKVWQNLRHGLNDVSNNVKTLLSNVFGINGGVAGILATGALSGFKLAQYYYDQWISQMKEAADEAHRNAESIAEAAAVNEKYRQSGESAMQKLSDLSKVEELSNVQKTEAVALIDQLNKQYGDLGISIDRTTGKILGLNRAMSVKLPQNKEKRIHEIDAQIQQLTGERNVQDKIISSESFWNRLIGNSKEKTAEALQKRIEIDQQLRELRIQRNHLLQSNPAADFLTQQSAVNENIEAQTRKREKDLLKRKLQDKINNSNTAGKMELINSEIIYEQKNLDQWEDALRKARNKYHSSTNAVDKTDAEWEMVDARAKVQQSKEKIYDWQQQLSSLKKAENETEALQKQEEQQREQENRKRFQESHRDKAQNLLYSAMEKAGLGREAAEERALRDAEKRKGSKLTDSEMDAVKKLTDLTLQMNNMQEPQFGNLAIQTNSLTARGGFQTGAVVPDSEKYQRITAENGKNMLTIVQRIETICRDFGKF